MISLRRPTAAEIADYRDSRLGSEPTCLPASTTPAGFRRERFSQAIGTSKNDFQRARSELQKWRAPASVRQQAVRADVPEQQQDGHGKHASESGKPPPPRPCPNAQPNHD